MCRRVATIHRAVESPNSKKHDMNLGGLSSLDRLLAGCDDDVTGDVRSSRVERADTVTS